MSDLSPHLREASPTVLEIRGFTPEATESLKTVFIENLQQPSYIAHASVVGTDSSRVERFRRVQKLRITCPVGFALSAEINSYRQGTVGFQVSELSLCCLSTIRHDDVCSSCRRPQGVETFDMMNIFPLHRAAEKDEDNEDAAPSHMDLFEANLEARLQRIPSVNVLSAAFMAAEISSLLYELAQYNQAAED